MQWSINAHSNLFPTCYQKLSSVKFWLACFFCFSCALALCIFALSCSHYLCRKEEIQCSDVGWVPRWFERQLRFHHVSLRGYSYVCAHARPISVPSEPDVAYFEPPALIAYLKLRGEESRCNLHAGALACSAIERWQMEISISEEDTVTSLVQGTDLFKNNVSFWATGTTESLRPQAKIDQRHDGLTNALCDLVSNYFKSCAQVIGYDSKKYLVKANVSIIAHI